MSSARYKVQALAYPQDKEEFYRTLTKRNFHFIPPATQNALRALKVLVAGCGSTGGACIEPLARLGVENFILADNGEYELTNLNRQHAFIENIGQNKAQFHTDCLRRINPSASVICFPEGITPQNIEDSVRWADIVIDAVDVTSSSGITMKLQLHKFAKGLERPVLTALDIGFRQWGRSYDYRNPDLEIFAGAYKKALASRHPMKVLFSIVPLSAVPAHSLALIEDLLTQDNVPASQLGCASDLLSAIIVPVIVRFVETGELSKGWNVDLSPLKSSLQQRLREYFGTVPQRYKLKKLLASTP